MRGRKKSGLKPYRAKRRFGVTTEPKGEVTRKRGNAFVIQKHAARRLHYDLRLELDGVMKSWAVTRGPSLVPGEKRLAVQVEDHPIAYNKFEGTIPQGEYGGGTVMIWDRGHWQPESDPHKGLAKGHLAFTLEGVKLSGGWHLVRMHRRAGEKRDNWLLIKQHDDAARSSRDEDILESLDLVAHELAAYLEANRAASVAPTSGERASGSLVVPADSLLEMALPPGEGIPPGFMVAEDREAGAQLQRVLDPYDCVLELFPDALAAREHALLEPPPLLVYLAEAVTKPPYAPLEPLVTLPPRERRQVFAVLVANNVKTLDGNLAFLYQVNLLLNRQHLAQAPGILYSALRHHQRLYRPYLAAVGE
jgi:DNA ligase D-like protein (predicted 3'-phosphoesterase)